MEPNEMESNEPNIDSLKLSYEILQKEYAYESERRKNLDTRSGVCITLVGALLVFLLSNMSISNIYFDKAMTLIQSMPYVFYFIRLAISIICFLVSLYFFVGVISVSIYSRFNISQLTSRATLSELEYLKRIVLELEDLISINGSANDKKIEIFKKGLFFIKISTLAGAVAYLLLFIIKFFKM